MCEPVCYSFPVMGVGAIRTPLFGWSALSFLVDPEDWPRAGDGASSSLWFLELYIEG